MSSLRVIAGKYRGRRLKPVPGDTTRPITDRVKESLFDIIGADISADGGASMLDLFAGTGAVGIEALSRGARFVRFNELNRTAAGIVKENLESTGAEKDAEISRMDAFALLERPADRRFEYVYIAPPQYKDMWKKSLLLLDERTDWLAEDAWVIVQIHPVEYEPMELENLVEFDERKYGSTLLVFYETRSSEFAQSLPQDE
jgi:16S rRNA (guanine(966)-N(2))-methyltransferase RsmD